MSSASAADNVTDIVANDAAQADDVVTALSEDVSDDVESQEVLALDANDSSLAQAESDDVLSGTAVPYGYYTLDLNDNYEISGKSAGKITYFLNPYQYSTPYGYNAYGFYFTVSHGKTVEYKSGNIVSDSDHIVGNRNLNIAAKTLAPGTYSLKAINIYDGHVMDSAVLKVGGNAAITASNYTAYYNSAKKTTVTLKDTDTGSPVKYVKVKAVFKKGTKTVTKYYTTNAKGQASFVPPVGIGTWTVTYSSGSSHIKANAVTKKVVIKKSKVAMKAFLVKGYEGLAATLKVIVKSQNKNVKEGTVTFAFNGKTYKVAVKNGVATKKVTLPKSKVYRFYALFKGSNFVAKKVSSKVISLKRYATKLIFKKVNVYYRSIKAAKTPFYVFVRTADGKVVNGGKVKIIDAVNVNRGVARFYLPTDLCYVGTKFMVIHYFKKVATKIFTVKYIPASKAYKPSYSKVLFREFYKCNLCGRTTSHTHSDSTYIVT